MYQKETTEPLVKNRSISAYKNILFYVFSRGKYGESEFAEASKHLEGVSEDDLKQSSASFHASCRKSTVSSEKLKRALVWFEKAVASNDIAALSLAPGRPSLESKSCRPIAFDETPSIPKRLSHMSTAAYNKEWCFFVKCTVKNKLSMPYKLKVGESSFMSLLKTLTMTSKKST